MVARVNLWKGQFYFLEIASLLKKKFPNLHFVMAGDAFPGYEYLYDEVRDLTQKLGLEDSVTNLGFRLDRLQTRFCQPLRNTLERRLEPFP